MKLTGKRIAVLAGGNSLEREVSIKSGERVRLALGELGCSAILVDPSVDYDFGENGMESAWAAGGMNNARKKRESREFTASSLGICESADAVFMALHGGAGENGLIAAVLECNGIIHTGSDFRGLCIAMDKVISKRLIESVGVLTPEYVAYSSEKMKDAVNLAEMEVFPGFPCVVKPVDGGSSLGVEMIESRERLTEALCKRSESGEGLLIERRIIGREFTVGVLFGEALAVTEIIPYNGFYDYGNKYIPGRTLEITPADLPSETEKRLKDAAIRAHNALFQRDYSRVDIILEAETERIYVLEVNSLPGMTATSLLPQGAAAVGIGFAELCGKMLDCALRRAKREGMEA